MKIKVFFITKNILQVIMNLKKTKLKFKINLFKFKNKNPK